MSVDVELSVEVGLLGAVVLLGAVQRGLLPGVLARSRAVRRPSGGRVAHFLLRAFHVGDVAWVVHAARVSEEGRVGVRGAWEECFSVAKLLRISTEHLNGHVTWECVITAWVDSALARSQ